MKGVNSVTSGYAGGTTENPTYSQVVMGKSGHAEVVRIVFDPNIISYSTLLDVFFTIHNPTLVNRQGADIGSEYRSVILYTSPVQKKSALEKISVLQARKVFDNPIVTELKPLDIFYEAESYHQSYYAKNPGLPYCQVVINPKLETMKRSYADLLKK